MHFLFLAQTAFSIWMMVDCARRDLPYYWFLIILMPFGEIVYFFAIKIDDPEFAGLRGIFTGKRQERNIREDFEDCASEDNRMALANQLLESGQLSEARLHYMDLLEKDGNNLTAMYGIALCHTSMGESDQAIELLETICQRSLKFKDYHALLDLCGLYLEKDDFDSAIAKMQLAATASGRMEHNYKLAVLYEKAGRNDEAIILLKDLKNGHSSSPRHTQQFNAVWFKKVNAKLATLNR